MLVGEDGGALAGGEEEGKSGEGEADDCSGGAVGMGDFHAVRLRLDRTDAVDGDMLSDCGEAWREHVVCKTLMHMSRDGFTLSLQAPWRIDGFAHMVPACWFAM